ncbi:MAG: type VI secretion system tube protein Hcp [Solirubrobacteraceae bacterium]
MGFGTRIRRPGRAALLLAVGAAGGGAALAVASVPDGNGVVHACYEVSPGSTVPVTTPGNVRIIDTAAGQSCGLSLPSGGTVPERSVSWNVTGPAGTPGLTGATGPTGPPGPPGQTLTVPAGHTFTVAGGGVITVGDSPGLTIAPPAVGNNAHPSGHVSFDPGSHGALGFDILAFSFAAGSKSSGTGSGGGTGKVSVHDIQITKVFDKTSPKIALVCSTGKHFNKVTIELAKHGKVYLKYTLNSVLVASYGLSSTSSKDVTPQENVTLNFAKMQIQYSPK